MVKWLTSLGSVRSATAAIVVATVGLSWPAIGAPAVTLPHCARISQSCAPCREPNLAQAHCAAGEVAHRGPPGPFDDAGCPRQCHTVTCVTPMLAPQKRHRRLTDTPPHPWPAPTIRHDHPRLFFDPAHLRRFRAHWHDPAYASIVREYNDDATLDPLSEALRGLAEKDGSACRLAARTVAGNWHPKMNLSEGPPGGTNWSLFGPPQAVYGDPAALVFDWCYFALTPNLKARLVAKIERQNAMREKALNKRFQWHESHFMGMHAYLMGVLAIQGEPGASDRLQKAQNVLQNWTDLGNELHGDGSYKTYAYQDLFLITPSIMWSMATGQDVVRKNQFIMHHADFLLRRLSQDGKDYIAGPGDQAADARGMIIRLKDPSPIGPLMIADYLHNGFAQWLGQFLLQKQGFSTRWDSPRWLDLIFHNDHLTPVPPREAGIPLVRYMPQGGMVDMRSAWNIGDAKAHDIDAWFYVGPMTAHSEMDVGDFTLWRGNDDLITEGANYLSRPTPYHLEWGALSFARNTAVFSPIGSTAPDLDGSQVPPQTMLYDDNRLFGDIGGERLIHGESPAARARLARLSAEHYPVANRLVWYPEYAAYLGQITDFRDSGAVAITTGDATDAYDPRYVKSYRRSVIDVKPNIFIIRDHFQLHDVGRVRMLFHVRQRPEAPGLHVVKGSANAGILEGTGNRVTIDRGQSQAVIQVLWPKHVKIRLVGGHGYESYIDGTNISTYPKAAEWLLTQPDYPARLARIAGAWRIELETTPAAANGQMIVAISAGPRGAPSPVARLTHDARGDSVVLRRANGSRIVVRLSDKRDPDREPAACIDR